MWQQDLKHSLVVGWSVAGMLAVLSVAQWFAFQSLRDTSTETLAIASSVTTDAPTPRFATSTTSASSTVSVPNLDTLPLGPLLTFDDTVVTTEPAAATPQTQRAPRPATTAVPPTAAPTTAAPTTVAPTTVAPTTAAPTTMPPETVPPETVPATTVPPETLPPETKPPPTTPPDTEPPTTEPPTTTVVDDDDDDDDDDEDDIFDQWCRFFPRSRACR